MQPIVCRPVQAPVQAPTGFAAYKLYLAGRARREGVREATIQSTIPVSDAQQPRHRARPGAAAGAADRRRGLYAAVRALSRASMSPPSLISRGQSALSPSTGRTCPGSRRSYGVDPAVLMAIYGKETSYGAITGNFDLLEALASLAYEGRRRAALRDRVHRRAEADRPRRPAQRGCKGS